jgi:thiamine kinase-like enzyme
LFFDALGDGISKPRRAIIELVYEKYPRILKHRIDGTAAQTLVHGDAHFWNVLFPKDTSQTPIWIDWQSWGVDFGAFDLAYMIGLHWFPERRSRFEKDLLAIYLSELRDRGTDYDSDSLAYDYRLQVVCQLFRPMFQWYMKAPAGLWWPHLDRWFSAFDDLDCHALLR